MKYRAKEIDGEWLVVDENEDIVADATDRKDAVLQASALNREESNSESKPKFHRGSSYGNKPEAELSEGSVDSVSDRIYKSIDFMYELTDDGQMAKNAYHDAKAKFKLGRTEAEIVLDIWNDSHKSDRRNFIEVETINELSKKTLGSYVKKATTNVSDKNFIAGHRRGMLSGMGKGDGRDKKGDDLIGKADKRKESINLAVNKLTKESEEMEIDEAGRTPKQGADEHAANELVLYAESDSDLYKQSALPIVANLQRKVKKGNYDPELAIKLWRYHADRAAKKYFKEFPDGNDFTFSPATRDLAAKEFRDNYEEHVMEAKPQDVKEENLQEAYDKLTDKQLQDKFVSLKVKSKDLSKDSKDSKELQKIRDEIAKRKNLKKESVENIQEAYDKLTDKQLQDKFVSLKVKSKDLSKDSKDSKELQKIRDEIAKRKNLKKESVESQDVMIAESIINILFGNIK